MFRDRAEAGQKLADRLDQYDPKQTVVIGLPRGGVPVAAEIARALGAPLDLVFVRKIGAPGQPELAMGAVADGPAPHVAINKDVAGFFNLDEDAINALTQPLLAEIERRRKAYFGTRKPLPLKDKTVIVVDDGIATGATMKAALEAINAQGPARVVVALPVAPANTLAELRALADDVVCLETPTPFIAVGNHYRNFDQTEDAEVVAILDALNG